MALSQQWLDELRTRITLSALIGRSIKITKAGREFKACCPFHNEKTPSFYVNDDKQFYHCHGCGAHGDAIRWMTDHKGLSFMDAVKELAVGVGMDVPARSAEAKKQDDKNSALLRVTAESARWFREQLKSPDGQAARDYLARRGISEELQERFCVGWAPDSKDGLRKAMQSIDEKLVIEAGMLITVDGKEPYDRFRGRVIIPINDARGRPIAFGGRILKDGQPKYLNSPDTPLFDKGRALFNYARAAEASRKTGRLCAVEGYMDAIACTKAGIEEVVAPLGTALTEIQLQLMWRLCPEPVLCFDGDAAGQKAAFRAAERALPFLEPGKSLYFAILPDGKDPDDVITTDGPAAMRDQLANAIPLVDMLWRNVVETGVQETPEQKAAVRQSLRDMVKAIKDKTVRDAYAAEYRQRFDQRGARPKNPDEPQQRRYEKPKAPKPDLSGAISGMEEILCRSIVALCMRFPRAATSLLERLAMVTASLAASAIINAVMLAIFERGAKTKEEIFATFDGETSQVGTEILNDGSLIFAAADENEAFRVLPLLISLQIANQDERTAQRRVVEDPTAHAIEGLRAIQTHKAQIQRQLNNQ